MDESSGSLENPTVVLTLTIDNSQPIELTAFVRAFTSLANEYKESLEKKGLDGKAKIYVAEVRQGSIVADLIPMIASAFPVVAVHVDQAAQAVDFLNRWKDRITKLASGIVPEGASRSELKAFAGAVQAIAMDPNGSSKLEVATFEDGDRKVKAAFKFTTEQAQAVEKTINGEFRRLDDDRSKIHERVLMYFTRSDVGTAPLDKRSGERVIVSAISEKSLPVMYASQLAEQRVKFEAREADDNIFKKGFNVDIAVQYRNERPIVYKIVQVHEVFDLPDEE